jgi:hypothetical protein
VITSIVLLFISAVFALATTAYAVWWNWALYRRPSVPLREGELHLHKELAFLRIDGGLIGKQGELFLTDQRLVWVAIRIPFPPLGNQSIEPHEIESCEVGQRAWIPWVRPLIVTTKDHKLELHIGTLASTSASERWRDVILPQKARATERLPPR